MRRRACAPRLARRRAGRRRDRRSTPPSYRFDLAIEEDLIEEVVALIGYDALADHAAARRRSRRKRAAANRAAAASRVRHALAALGYQETINFSFVEERWERDFAGNAEPIRPLNPIASQMSVMRSSAARLPGRRCCKFNLDAQGRRACACSSSAACSCATRRVPTDRSTVARRAPADAASAAWPTAPADALQWGAPSAAVDFFDVKGDVEALLAPPVARFVAAAHPALHPGPLRRDRARRHARRRRRRAAPALAPELRAAAQRRCLRARRRGRCTARRCRAFEPLPQATSRRGATSPSIVGRRRHARGADGRDATPPTGGLCASATLFDVYEPQAGARRHRRRREQPRGALELRERRTHTDRRADRCGRAAPWSTRSPRRLGGAPAGLAMNALSNDHGPHEDTDGLRRRQPGDADADQGRAGRAAVRAASA